MTWSRLFFAAVIALAAGSAFAQYPNRPLRLIVPFPPGGAVDVLGRAVALNAHETLGQNIVVDNRPGAGGAVGTYDPVRDFAPITLVAFVPHLLVSSASVPAATLKEFIKREGAKWAKAVKDSGARID